MGIQDKIKEVEAEMARTQKNKATEYHLGQLKAKLAKLRTQLQTENSSGKGGPGEGSTSGATETVDMPAPRRSGAPRNP